MKKITLPLIIAISIIIGILLGNFYATRQNNSFTYSICQSANGNKISEVLNIVNNLYVDSISMDSLVETALPLIITQLDPHSSYIPASELTAVNEELSGSFGGIGVQFNLQNDTIYIINVIAGGPSAKAGILAGDKIVSVNDSVFVGKKINNELVMRTLKGNKGSSVKIGIIRQNNPKQIFFNITRGDIPVKSVDIAYMITPKIGYISVNKFGGTTAHEFQNSVAKLLHNGAKSMIIDLRGNAGGYLDAAQYMLNQFLKRGELIVYMQGEHQPRRDLTADGSGSCQNIGLAVLIDEFSGSASEIFAGAIQDNDRGTIIGRRSFGKGLVQQQVDLYDKSALRLTVARYYTPSGRCIQKPYKRGDSENYQLDLLIRYKHGEFYSQDSIQQNTSEAFKTRSGRTVYSGGGIMPDIFVPQDTAALTRFASEIINRGLTYKFALQYTDNHRVELQQIKDWKTMQKKLENENLVEKIVDFARKNDISSKNDMNAKAAKYIENQTFAYIIRNILDDDGFFPYYNQNDNCVKKAIEELQK
ncbi:MAG: S41 family peptidase [Prevotellaceae bacterium]|jgi:carboxyl-terminal processing protease|nr:S41 family peptidase [Prevotellaceae bacterium]